MLSQCSLPPSQPITNGDLNHELDVVEAAWAQCAAQVDQIVNCQADDLAQQQTRATRDEETQ